jgi:hypothetical protein
VGESGVHSAQHHHADAPKEFTKEAIYAFTKEANALTKAAIHDRGRCRTI